MKKLSGFMAVLAGAAALASVVTFFACKTEADDPAPSKTPSITIGSQETPYPEEGSATAAKFPVTFAYISGLTSDTAITFISNDLLPPPQQI